MTPETPPAGSAPGSLMCHDRPMLAVQNRSTENGLPYDEPVWWCADCHKAIPRDESKEQPPVGVELDPRYLAEFKAWSDWLEGGGYETLKRVTGRPVPHMASARITWGAAWNAARVPEQSLAARLVAWYDTHYDPAVPPDEHAACELRALVDEARGVVQRVEEK